MAVGDTGAKGRKAAAASAAKSAAPSSGLTPAVPGSLAAPIVVPNTMWKSTNPLAYAAGGKSDPDQHVDPEGSRPRAPCRLRRGRFVDEAGCLDVRIADGAFGGYRHLLTWARSAIL